MNYLTVYNENINNQVRLLLEQGRLGAYLLEKYSSIHQVNNDKALYGYVVDLKNRYFKNAQTPSKVLYDADLKSIQRALGTHTAISRVQGGKHKAKNEIRIASLFQQAPPEFLKMIVVHELAHLKEKAHNRAFYQLCMAMEPDYHQIELDVRIYLTYQNMLGELAWSK